MSKLSANELLDLRKEKNMKVIEENINIVISVKKELLHSDIPEFINLKNQIAKCLYKSGGKEKDSVVDLFEKHMKGMEI